MSLADIARFIVYEPLLIVMLYALLFYLGLRLFIYYTAKSISFILSKLIEYAKGQKSDSK